MESAVDNIAVIIPSRGRPEELAETLFSIQRQTVISQDIILAVTSEQDVSPDVLQADNVTLCIGEAGVRQRGTGRSAPYTRESRL